MLRSLLLGVLALSTASACKGGGDAPTVQPGVAVGKVVELSGDVSATRGSAKRALATGQEISGDDIIETGAQATVRIVFAHNNATWELGPNKKQLVSESLAWKAPKANTPAGEVSEATLAAGRHAERETVTTSSTAPSRAPEAAAPASAEPAAAPAPPTGGSAPGATIGGKAGGDERRREDTARADDGATKERARDKGQEGASMEREVDRLAPKPARRADPAPLLDRPASPVTAPSDSPPPPPPPPPAPPTKDAKVSPADDVKSIVGAQRTELAKCLDTTSLAIEIVVAKGKATFVFPAGTSDAARSCFSAIAAKLSFPPDYTVKTTMSFKK